MARFLSGEWFDQVAGPAIDEPVAVLEQIVTGTADGDIRYHVVIGQGRAVLARGPAQAPDATFTEDYSTATAIARGELTTQAALLEGHIQVAGNMAALAGRQDDLAGLDPVPPSVRATTTY